MACAIPKEAYVRKKYQESAKIFTTAYSWFVREMEKYVKKPDGAGVSVLGIP